MNETVVTQPAELEIRVERVFDAPRAHVFSFETAQERDTTMQYGVEEGAKGGFARVDEVLRTLAGG